MSVEPQKYLAKSPYCNHVLDPQTAVDGWVTCECGHKSDVRWVSELGWLQSRSDWVSERISKSEAWFDSRHQNASATSSKNPASSQQLLYILGALSLVVAVAVFTAVAWEKIGAYGQLAALMAVVAVASAVAVKSRSRLEGLSNTAAIISTIVAATGLLSAPYFGLVDESWGDGDSLYVSVVFITLVLASFAAGHFSKISGWTLISIITVLPTAFIFTDSFLSSQLIRTGYLVAAMVSLTVSTAAVAIMFVLAKSKHAVSDLYKVVVTAVELILVFAIFTKAMDSLSPSEFPLIVGLSYALIALFWFGLSTRLPKSNEGFSANAVSTIAKYVGSALAGFAIPIACLPSFSSLSSIEPWQLLPGSADLTLVLAISLGAIVMVAPLFAVIRKLESNRFFTITAAVAWYATTDPSNRSLFEQPISETVTLFSFAIISVALTLRWWKEINPGFFISAVLPGCMAVGYGVNTFLAPSFDGPEPVTFSVAIYLVMILQLLVYRTKDPHNSFVVWGIPLTVVLVPSSIAATALLHTDFPGATEWLRFWSVILVSVTAILLGLRTNLSGVLIPGIIGFAIVLLPQIFLRLSNIVPRWIIFGVIGVLLITIAARFEHLQRLGRDTSKWFKRLH